MISPPSELPADLSPLVERWKAQNRRLAQIEATISAIAASRQSGQMVSAAQYAVDRAARREAQR